MSFRELVFAVVLTVAAAAVVIGVGQVYVPAAWIVGGLLAAGLGWLVLASDAEDAAGTEGGDE